MKRIPHFAAVLAATLILTGAVSKTWPGGSTNTSPTTYSIPEAGDLNWSSLTNFLQALANSAQSTTFQKFAVRRATTTPVTVSATTDAVIVTAMASPSAVTVNLPAGATKQLFIVVDGTGDAATNAITVDGNGSENINGATTYVINKNYAGIMMIWDGTQWTVISEFNALSGSGSTTALTQTNTVTGITNKTFSDSTTKISDNSDATKIFQVEASGITTGTTRTMTVPDADFAAVGTATTQTLTNKTLGSTNTLTGATASSFTNTGTVTLFTATDTVVGKATTDTFTNKTIDADGTGNSITNIENADIKAGAAIARTKIANGTADHVVINDGSGTLSSEAALSPTRGGTGVANGAGETLTLTGDDTVEFTTTANTSVTLPTTGTLSTLAGSETLTNKALTSPTMTAPTVSNYANFTESAAPSTPAAGTVAVYAKTDKKLYKKDSNGTESEVGAGGGSGEVNYISNSDFETGATTGWATYDDGASATPVNGTGGSPATLTLSANATTPLRGSYDFKVAKSAADSQGEGWSYDFTIKAPDVSKKLKIQFDYNATDSNYTAGDVVLYVYDVTNAALITPSVTSLPKSSGTWQITFDSTTSTSYRLIAHWAVTTASAVSLYFDSVVVGPGVVVQGAAVSDWISYTPSSLSGGGWGTATNIAMYYRRVGSNMEIKGSFRVGTRAASNALLSLPTGHTINTTGLTTGSNSVGIASFQRTAGGGYATDAYVGPVFITTTDTSNLYFTRNTDASGAVPYSATVVTSLMNADTSYVVFASPLSVPIAEWSGTVNLMNDQFAMMNARAKWTKSTTAVVVNGATVPYDSQIYNSGGGFTNNGSGVVTVNFTGTVEVTGHLSFASNSGSGMTLQLRRNTSSTLITGRPSAGGADGRRLEVTGTVSVTAGDTLSIRAQDSADTPGTNTGESESSFSLVRIPEYTAGQTVGFGLASSTSSGLVTREESLTNQSKAYTGALTGNATINFSRVGKQVVISADSFSGTSGSTTTINFAAGTVPSSYAPSAEVRTVVSVEAAGTNTAGVAIFGTDGAITVYGSVGFGTFTSGGTAAVRLVGSWTVD